MHQRASAWRVVETSRIQRRTVRHASEMQQSYDVLAGLARHDPPDRGVVLCQGAPPGGTRSWPILRDDARGVRPGDHRPSDPRDQGPSGRRVLRSVLAGGQRSGILSLDASPSRETMFGLTEWWTHDGTKTAPRYATARALAHRFVLGTRAGPAVPRLPLGSAAPGGDRRSRFVKLFEGVPLARRASTRVAAARDAVHASAFVVRPCDSRRACGVAGAAPASNTG